MSAKFKIGQTVKHVLTGKKMKVKRLNGKIATCDVPGETIKIGGKPYPAVAIVEVKNLVAIKRAPAKKAK